jgi:hypothetical protein
MPNETILSISVPDRAEEMLHKDFASKAVELFSWSKKIAMIPKSWNESDLLDFVDELQRRTNLWQKQIEENFIDELNGDNRCTNETQTYSHQDEINFFGTPK